MGLAALKLNDISINPQMDEMGRNILAEIENNKYKYFRPNGAVEKYIRAVGELTNKRIFLFSAANGVGKTSGVINILANIFWESGNKFFKFERYKKWPYPKEFWYCSEHSTLKETVVSEIEKWFPAGRYDLKKSQGYPIDLTTDTGYHVAFKRYDQEASKWESATLGCVVFDEPPRTEKQYTAGITRTRLGGILLMPMTPLFKAGFVKDRIVDDNEDAYVQFADVWENSKSKGVRGILKDEDIEFMIRNYDDEEKEARVYGKFMFLAGLVFKEFTRGVHVISIDEVEKMWTPSVFGEFESWPKIMLIDPHDRRADMVGYAAVAPDNSYIIYDEYPDENVFKLKSRRHDIKQTLYECFQKEKGYTEKEWKGLHRSGKRLEIFKRVMDRWKGAQNVADMNISTIELYQRRSKEIGNPVSFELSFDDNRAPAHKPIHELLNFKIENDAIVQRPRLYILRDCENFIYAFEHYSYDDPAEKTAERKELSEKVQSRFKCPIDLLRYLTALNIDFSNAMERVKMNRNGDGYDRKKGNRFGSDGWMA